VRIIRGSHKGKKIVAPKNIKARPTTDFAKEGLFNILENKLDFESISVLDLFCGTGNISLEFASRGAERVLSVDIALASFKFLNNVIRQLELEHVHPIKKDAYRYLRTCSEKFDVIFADPPYENEHIRSIPGLVFDNELLEHEGYLIVEHSKQTDFSDNPYLVETRNYGKVNFSFFEHPENE